MLCFFAGSAEAQYLKLLNDDLYKSRVKLVSEFMDRFNGKRVRPDIETDTLNKQMTNLLFLFDRCLLKSKHDSVFHEAESFAAKVIEDSVMLQYSDTAWCAKAKCRGKLSGKQVDFVLFLNVERREADMYKWVITKADGSIFELDAPKQHSPYMLMPDSHETNFMSLGRMTAETPGYVKDFKSCNYEIDQTSVFFSLVKNGLLKIDYVEDLTFLFFQVPGYVFSVKKFEREELNAGWLISSLQKYTVEEKDNLLLWLNIKK